MVKTLTASLRQTFNVAVAEVDHQDLWQRTTIAVAAVAGEGYHLKRVMHEVERHIERFRAVELIDADAVAARPGRLTRRTMSGGARPERVAEEFREVLAEEIPRLKDPRVGFVTVTRVEVTPDLRRAIVFYTVLGRGPGPPRGPGPACESARVAPADGARPPGPAEVHAGAGVRGGRRPAQVERVNRAPPAGRRRPRRRAGRTWR